MTQLDLPLETDEPVTWGGAREGAGRPRNRDGGVPHRSRDEIPRRCPLHVTLRLVKEGGNLRTLETAKVLRGVFHRGRDRFGFRLIHFSVQHNHLHLIVEADDGFALYRGMTGLAVRVARGINRLRGRTGQVLAERYHARPLTTPRAVRNCLAYVLNNASHHDPAPPPEVRGPYGGVDRFSSGFHFDGWREHDLVEIKPTGPSPVVPASVWLLKTGWRSRGLIDFYEIRGGVG